MKRVHTDGMKIAISIPDDVYREIDRIAKEQKTSRSQVFVSAAREYIRKRETNHFVEKLDEVYSELETTDEKTARKAMASYQRRRRAGSKTW
jgi:metal-responsive CopG/Arc/MetJ family transcriptional regulator